jgi:hypothetical protein
MPWARVLPCEGLHNGVGQFNFADGSNQRVTARALHFQSEFFLVHSEIPGEKRLAARVRNSEDARPE